MTDYFFYRIVGRALETYEKKIIEVRGARGFCVKM